jgi:hypothetical protein
MELTLYPTPRSSCGTSPASIELLVWGEASEIDLQPCPNAHAVNSRVNLGKGIAWEACRKHLSILRPPRLLGTPKFKSPFDLPLRVTIFATMGSYRSYFLDK